MTAADILMSMLGEATPSMAANGGVTHGKVNDMEQAPSSISCEDLLPDNAAICSVCKSLLSNERPDDRELDLLAAVKPADADVTKIVKSLIASGADPLGDAYMRANRADERRPSGAVYTPIKLVSSMLKWAAERIEPARVVDCGCGSGRFAIMAARMFPDAQVVAVDTSPMATLMCKAHAVAADVAVTVVRDDFTRVRLPPAQDGPTLWIGNPPYVRHHDLTVAQKEWFSTTLGALGAPGNRLAGLHVHFVASIAKRCSEGDVGCLVTSAEWMDTRYGVTMRDVLTKRLGLTLLRTFDKRQATFSGTMSSAVVFGFEVGRAENAVTVNGHAVDRSSFATSSRWSEIVSGRQSGRDNAMSAGFVRLGDIARVHRGVVTGKNSFWVRRPGEVSEHLSTPIVSHARELSGDTPALRNVSELARLVTLPEDLSSLPDTLREEAQDIVNAGLADHVDKGFVARHRRSWWSVKPPKPPAIMMTYMARHAPVFVVNSDGLGMLNVVHGIYPNVELSDRAIANLVAYLNANVEVSDGRIYSGGLAKFEPGEVEQLIVPSPEMLEA